MKTIKNLIPLILSLTTINSWAECTFTVAPANGQGYIYVNIDTDLSNVQSRPNYSTLFESPTQTYQGRSNYACTTFSYWGIKNNVGTDSPSSDLFPIGDTGFAWRWTYNGVMRKGTTAYPIAEVNGSIGFTGSTHSMQLLKIGTIKNGAKIPAGILGYIQVEGFVQPMAMVLTKEISIASPACQASALPVRMGTDYRLDEFDKAGATPRIIKFNINLSQCESGINKVTYSLQSTSSSQAIDWQQGIVGLSSNPKAAKGVALQLMNEVGKPIALNTIYQFNGFTPNGKSFNIPLSASYYRLPNGKLEAGIADASVTFIVNYL